MAENLAQGAFSFLLHAKFSRLKIKEKFFQETRNCFRSNDKNLKRFHFGFLGGLASRLVNESLGKTKICTFPEYEIRSTFFFPFFLIFMKSNFRICVYQTS